MIDQGEKVNPYANLPKVWCAVKEEILNEPAKPKLLGPYLHVPRAKPEDSRVSVPIKEEVCEPKEIIVKSNTDAPAAIDLIY